MKKKKEVKKRHMFIINIAKILLTPILKFKYKYHFKYHKELKKDKPFLVLGNHSLGIDPILMSLSFPFHLYYFATEQIMNLGLLSKLLIFAANPIKKTKSKSDLTAIRKAKQIVSEGGSIGLFPEGNISYTGETNKIDDSVVKLIRLLKIPVIIFRFEGLFLTSSRWSVKNKRSYSNGSIYKIIEFNQYDKLNDEELYELIKDGLYVNAYNKNEIKYQGKNKALGLERLVFMDLELNIPNVTYTKKNSLYSKISNFKLDYDEYGFVTNNLGIKYDLIEINKQVISSYLKFYQTNKIKFETTGILFKNIKGRKRKIGIHKIILENDGVSIKNKVNLKFLFSEMESFAIQGKRQIIIYENNNTWLIRFDETVSPYQFLLTYQFNLKGEEIYDTNNICEFGL